MLRLIRSGLWAVMGLLLILSLHLPPAASASIPVNLARPTWDTGWFQAEVYRELLQRLGYRVDGPHTLDNDSFYKQAAEGTMDLWANGWFPLHETYLAQDAIAGKVAPVGFEVPGGALQGYVIDQATAKRLNIQTLGDLAQPEVAAEFDYTGDGKADLISCNVGWACAEVIDHHLQEYGLRDTVTPIQGDYAPLLEETIERYRQGKPVLFYTWTPNWPISQLMPGQDVVWLEVPYPSLPTGQESLESETSLTGIQGCMSDPCQMGFPRNDIRAVANTAFLAANPAVQSLLEQVTIPVEDIADQNAKMLSGEGTEADIRRHAQAWLQANDQQVAQWIAAAQAVMENPVVAANVVESETDAEPLTLSKPLRVVTQRFEPLVIYENQQYQGFSLDLWDAIATELDIPYELFGVNSVAKLLDEVQRGAADIAVAGIGITSQAEATLDFSYPYYESGLQVLVRGNRGQIGMMLSTIGAVLRSPRLYGGVGILVLILLIVAHILWFSEHRHNTQFPRSYLHGIWESFWWAAVTVTTVGYGDKVPQKFWGRFFGLIWMFAGYFVLAYFTASIATTFTVQELRGTINGPEDLPGKRIATIANSAAAEYLDLQANVFFHSYSTQEETLAALQNNQVDAVVYDAPVLQYFASHDGAGKYEVVGSVFQALNYGIALQQESPYREPINAALLKLYEMGKYDEIHQQWFG